MLERYNWKLSRTVLRRKKESNPRTYSANCVEKSEQTLGEITINKKRHFWAMKRHIAVSEKNYRKITELRKKYEMKDNNTVVTSMIERLAEYHREIAELKQRQKT